MPSPHPSRHYVRNITCQVPQLRPNAPGNKSSRSWFHRERASHGSSRPVVRGQRWRRWACEMSLGYSQSLRGRDRNRASWRQEALSHLPWSSGLHMAQVMGGGITWEGVPGRDRGGGTECYSTRTSPCSGGTPCPGRSLHAP